MDGGEIYGVGYNIGFRILLNCAPVHREGWQCESSNSRDISLLSVVGKLFGRVLIKRVRAGTECAIGEEKWGLGRVEVAWTKCLL